MHIHASSTTENIIVRDLVHPSTHGNKALGLAEVTLAPGHQTTLHRHLKSEVLYYILDGHGVMTIGDKTFPIVAGDAVLVPPKQARSITTAPETALRFLRCCSSASVGNDTEHLQPVAAHAARPPLQLQPTPRRPSALTAGSLNAAGLLKLRRQLRLNQNEFWKHVSVTQSAGSRYEGGRAIPQPTKLLLLLIYTKDKDANALLTRLRHATHDAPQPKAAQMKLVDTAKGAEALRLTLRLNQTQFWRTIGVTQSGGSRYESGRKMPRGIPTLLRLAFGPEATALKLLENLRTRVTQPQ